MASAIPASRAFPNLTDLPAVHIQSWDVPVVELPSSSKNSASSGLQNLLSNSLIANQITPYLPLSSLIALTATCHAIHNSLSTSVHYVDLSPIKALVLPESTAPLDVGGNIWRAERMDEALTEDEFYGGPLRGTFATLTRQHWLDHVSTLILDGLTVTSDVVREIIAEDRFNVRILSIRDVKQLNYRKLCQLLKYAVRPTRPPGMPKLRGMYVFGPREPALVKDELPTIGRRRSPTRYPESRPSATISAVGAHLGPEWAARSQVALIAERHEADDDKWFHSAGKIISRAIFPEWAETLQACEGIIAFDAVLCRGPRHDLPAPDADESKWLPPAVATVALGPDGCQKCHTAPEGVAVFGQSPSHHLPLLAPPPLGGCSVRAAQMPSSAAFVRYGIPKVIARCKECLKNRFCDRCHKWWCESCYQPSEYVATMQGEIQVEDLLEFRDTKVLNDLCVDMCLAKAEETDEDVWSLDGEFWADFDR